VSNPLGSSLRGSFDAKELDQQQEKALSRELRRCQTWQVW
jgi:hypothetical protein